MSLSYPVYHRASVEDGACITHSPAESPPLLITSSALSSIGTWWYNAVRSAFEMMVHDNRPASTTTNTAFYNLSFLLPRESSLRTLATSTVVFAVVGWKLVLITVNNCLLMAHGACGWRRNFKTHSATLRQRTHKCWRMWSPSRR